MTDPGQAGILIVGGGMSRAEFDAILAEHGWAIHTAALSAHTRYTELFKTEFIQRNRLTKKQQELIQLVGHGLMDKQIATELGVSVSAIRQRLSVIQTKTGAQNRADLAALATRIGLVPDPLLKPHTKDLTVFLSTGDGKSGTEYSIERDEPEPGVS
jgi:DNA-binding CsgD family transcriptional regulator